ncbi:MAG TPA: hypothetical protein ENI70_00755 [Candidatus Peregrinibacteria bacterium]|nr:hypothetical protein [Candidatus Peregrinibacteria bacterium]
MPQEEVTAWDELKLQKEDITKFLVAAFQAVDHGKDIGLRELGLQIADPQPLDAQKIHSGELTEDDFYIKQVTPDFFRVKINFEGTDIVVDMPKYEHFRETGKLDIAGKDF